MKDKEFILRIISSFFIVTIVLFFVYSYNIFIDYIILFAIGILMAYEWENIVCKSEKKKLLGLVGVIYISFTLIPLLLLKFLPNGEHLLMWLFLLVWSTDTFAYIVGAKFKLNKHKITTISPKKSYEGLFGGMFGAMVVCYIFANFFLPEQKNTLLFFTPMLCILEQAGDITESYLKRKFNIKDSGNLIPGHGGFLDRFDGFLYTTLMLLFILNFS